MSKEILIISRYQFGYHTDIYKWCYYLRNFYNVSIVTLNTRKPLMDIENVNIHYVPSCNNRLVNGILFILVAIWNISKFKGLIIVHHFAGCGIFKRIFKRKKIILDIRSLSVSKDNATRNKYNNNIKKDTKLYDFVTVISEGVRKQLSLPNNKSAILPLGSDPLCEDKKDYNSIRLLYVGTLTNRNIDKTIMGILLFLKKHPDAQIEYDIIGNGRYNEKEVIDNLINDYNLSEIIKTYGFINHSKLKPFFERSNIGVSFVPITDYYEHQPPTKTFEYILSGLYTIATDTFSNREIISKDNGCLIKDSAESFAEGLEIIWENRQNIETVKIRESLSNYKWKNIINNIMIPILEINKSL